MKVIAGGIKILRPPELRLDFMLKSKTGGDHGELWWNRESAV